MNKSINHAAPLSGLFSVPGDKSLCHRALLAGAVSDAAAEIEGLACGQDILATINCLKALGVNIETNGKVTSVHGVGLRGLRSPDRPLDCKNSGTTMRLLCGLLAGQNTGFEAVLTGDESLRKRPMGRIVDPLRLMGADIASSNGFAPITIKGAPGLKAIEYSMPVSSAQVKSALLLAGLYADGVTTVREKAMTRNHTEILLNYLGIKVLAKRLAVTIEPADKITSKKIYIAGDFSQAAYFIGAALIIPGSDIIITNVSVNFTRIGLIQILREMGADIEIMARRNLCGEAVADISVRHRPASLKGTIVSGGIIPRLIDEIPILAVIALFAEGETIIRDARELRVKESDRINAVVSELLKFGADVKELPDGMVIQGGKALRGALVNSHMDHRIAMALGVLGLAAEGETVIENSECVDVSFPNFFEALGQ